MRKADPPVGCGQADRPAKGQADSSVAECRSFNAGQVDPPARERQTLQWCGGRQAVQSGDR